MTKQIYKKGMKFVHKQTNNKVSFLKWLDENTANCIDPKTGFVKLTREQIENDYVAESKINREYREKRKGHKKR